MSVTKHKIFRIPISNDVVIDENEFRDMNAFLANPNYIYISHAISVLSDQIKVTSQYRLVNRFVIISLVYKDLSESPLDLKSVSKKTVKVVKTAIENDEALPKPNYQTNFEKSNKKAT